MRSALLLLTLALPARAGVVASAEAGADAAVPRISLQSSLSPMSGPALGTSLTPGLNASLSAPSLAAPSLVTAQALPAPLAVSAVVAAAAVRTDAAAKPVPAALASAYAAPALTEGPQSKTDPEAAAAAEKTEPGAPSFKTKILAMLKSLANPFGGKSAEDAPKSEAQRLDGDFTKLDLWSRVGPEARAEIERLRAAKTGKAELKAYVRAAGREALAKIQAAGHTGNVGFHYNLHGGRREDYVGRGINATMGDIALQYSMHGDRNYKVYFFQSAETELYDLLNESHPQMLMLPSRMGSTLNLFNLEAPELKAAMADGRIKNMGHISMDFHGMGGVPYSAYLAPPLEVFYKTARKVGLPKLSRDEETLATIRYLEAAAAAGSAYIPR